MQGTRRKYDKVQEVAEEQTKERMEKIFIQLKGALDKVIKTFTKDTEVSSYYNIANMYMWLSLSQGKPTFKGWKKQAEKPANATSYIAIGCVLLQWKAEEAEQGDKRGNCPSSNVLKGIAPQWHDAVCT